MLVKQLFSAMLGIFLSGGPDGGSLEQEYEAFFKKCYAGGVPDQVIASCSVVIGRQAVDKEDLATALKNRANAFDDKGDYARALEDFDRAVAINPQDADAFNSRGTTYTGLGRHESAIQDFDKAIQLNPSSPMAFSNRCFARAVLGQLEEALVAA